MSGKKLHFSLFHCWRTIRQLRDLKDLIRHHRRWAHQLDLARPLEELGISEKDPHRFEKITQRINELIPMAIMTANAAGAPTGIVRDEKSQGKFPPEREKNEYDLLVHWDLLLTRDESSAATFNMMIGALDQLIGYCSEIRARILFGFLNPLRLIAYVLRLPITMIEYMGFEVGNDWVQKLMAYGVYAAWILFLAILAVYFGDKSPVVKAFFDFMRGRPIQ